MNGQNLLSSKNVKDDGLVFEDKNLVKISRSKLGYFSAITLPMILAACGGGGGRRRSVSPTPDSGSVDQALVDLALVEVVLQLPELMLMLVDIQQQLMQTLIYMMLHLQQVGPLLLLKMVML